MQDIQLPCELDHAILERCFLKRIEGVIWIVSVKTPDGIEFRVPPSRHKEFSIMVKKSLFPTAYAKVD